MTTVLNYWVDPVGIFDDGRHAEAAASQLVAGRDLVAANIADRQLQLAYARTVKDAPQIIVFGSSRIMEIGSAMAPGERLYNAGVSTMTLPDLLGIAEAFIEAGKMARVVVIGVDPWLFDGTPRNNRWRALTLQYKSMLAKLGAIDDMQPAAVHDRMLNLISLSYTIESLRAVFKNWRAIIAGEGASDLEFANESTRVAVKRFDGSLRYGEDMRNRDVAEIRAIAVGYGHKEMTAILAGGWLAPRQIDLFERLVRFLQSHGSSVVLLMPPYHPADYAYVRERDEAKSFVKTEAIVREIGQQTGAIVAGSYDPAVASCDESEFWDGMHARGSCLARILSPALTTIASNRDS